MIERKTSTVKLLTTQAKVGLFIVPAVLIFLILGFGYFMFVQLTQEGASQLTRQLSVDTATTFHRHIRGKLALREQLHRSYTIGRWLSDPHNENYRTHALRDIQHLHQHYPDMYLSFVSYAFMEAFLLQGYSPEETAESFRPWGQMTLGGGGQWLYDTLASPVGNIINIQELQDGAPYIWFTNRVYYEGELVGVLAVGQYFAELLDTVFTQAFLEEEIRGYLIDPAGFVRANSDGEWFSSVDRRGITDITDEAIVLEEMAAHKEKLASIGGVFDMYSLQVEPFSLTATMFAYGGIAPVLDTGWSILILQEHVGAFDDVMIVAFVGMVLFGFIVFIFLVMYVIRRYVLRPIGDLTRSIQRVADGSEAGDDTFYGLDRDDEIGYLAKTIDQMHHKLTSANQELQQIEIIKESNKAKKRYLARMSHEIRTPISAIMGIAEMQIKRGGLPIKVASDFNKIYSSGNLLLNIINDVLDLSRIEAGKMELMNEKYHLGEMISDVMQGQVISAIQKDLVFELEVDEKLPIFLRGDVVRIKQMVTNLLSNAFKYTITGGVFASFEQGFATEDGEEIYLIITVKDTGIGMTQEHVDRIYTEYARFVGHEYRNIEGAGLGMPIVQSLAQLMGATVLIDSEPNQGTIVTLSIPQQVIEKENLGLEEVSQLKRFREANFVSAAVPRFEVEPMPYGRVLVVDDLDLNLYVAEEMLAMYQIKQIETVTSGQAAIDKIKAGKVYDVIFMDHMMPGLDGLETLLALRELGYTRPVVALTANAMIGQAERFLSVGFDDFISKPIDSKRFNDVLTKYISDIYPAVIKNLALEELRKKGPVVLGGTDRDEAMRAGIIKEFKKSQQYAAADLKTAVAEQDMKKAHLIAHSLKGAAGLLGEKILANLAGNIERSLKNEQYPTTEQMKDLRKELILVLDKLADAAIQEAVIDAGKITDPETIKELLKVLEPLLMSHNMEALNYVAEVQQIKGGAQLASHIDDFEFELAQAVLQEMKGQFL